MKFFSNQWVFGRMLAMMVVCSMGIATLSAADCVPGTVVVQGPSYSSSHSSSTEYRISKGPSWQSGSGALPIAASRIGHPVQSRNVTEIDLGFYQYRKESTVTPTVYQDFYTGTVVTEVQKTTNTYATKRPLEVYAPNGVVIMNPGLYQQVQGSIPVVSGVSGTPSMPTVPCAKVVPVAATPVVVAPAAVVTTPVVAPVGTPTTTIVIVQQPQSRLRIPYTQLIP